MALGRRLFDTSCAYIYNVCASVTYHSLGTIFMNLKDKLMADLRQALRDGDTLRKSTIRLLQAAITVAEKAGERQRILSEEEIQAVIAKQVKQRRDSIAAYTHAGRADLAAQEEAELQILLEYMPKQMTREEITAAAQEVIEELHATDPKQIGQVMRELMPKVKGRADGRLVNQIVRELLAK